VEDIEDEDRDKAHVSESGLGSQDKAQEVGQRRLEENQRIGK
jgi:hypothetical protein